MLLLPQHFFLPAPPLAAPSPSRFRFRPLSCTTDTTVSSTTASSFSIEDYLANKCNLYPSVVARVAPELSHLKSPSKPDAVLAFLSTSLDLSPPLVAVAIARDPKLLTASVDKTLAPRAAELRDLGFSPFQIGLLIVRRGAAFRSRTLISRLQFWLPFLGGRVHKLLFSIQDNPNLLTADLRVVKSTIKLLKECGITDDDVGFLCTSCASKLLTSDTNEVEAVLARAEELGVPRNTRPFLDAIITAFCMSPEKIAWRVEFFKNELGWSEKQIQTAVSKMARVLMTSVDRLRNNWKFLTEEVGMDAERVAAFPAILKYDLDRRLVPRHRVIRLLQARGLLWHERDFRGIAAMSEQDFVGKFIRPFLVKVPNLAELYEAAGGRRVPPVDRRWVHEMR